MIRQNHSPPTPATCCTCLLSEGERWFVDVFTQAVPLIKDSVQQVSWMFQQALGDRGLAGKESQEWLTERLAIIAAIEHMTAMLGNWVLNATALDAAGADPIMMDLLR